MVGRDLLVFDNAQSRLAASSDWLVLLIQMSYRIGLSLYYQIIQLSAHFLRRLPRR
jgi:hypothetical protein